MRRLRTITRVTMVLGIFAIVGGPMHVVAGTDEPNQVVNFETIFASLDAGGTPKTVRLVDNLRVFGQGDVVVTDPTSTEDFRMLSGFGSPEVGDDQVTYTVEGLDGVEEFVSVSNPGMDPPVGMLVTYMLEGERIEPEELVGRSGDVQVVFDVYNNTAEPREVTYKDGAGERHTVTEEVPLPMVAQLQLELPAEHFSKIDAPDAEKVTSSRGDITLLWNLVMVPPIGDTVQSVELSTEVEDFQLGPVRLTAVPVAPKNREFLAFAEDEFAHGRESASGLYEGSTQLGASMEDLHDGTLELLDGMTQLLTGAQELAAGLGEAFTGSGKLTAGLNEAHSGSAELTAGLNEGHAGSGKITDGLGDAEKGSGKITDGLGDLEGGMSQIGDGLNQLGREDRRGHLYLARVGGDRRPAAGRRRAGRRTRPDSGEPAFALVRPPGHHAERDRAMGFCLYNNVAVAARGRARRGIARVAIVDIDVHHGNGTQRMFYDDPSVLYVSSHQFPLLSGHRRRRRDRHGRRKGFTLNVPLEAGATDADYDLAYSQLVVPVLDQFRPQLTLVSAGYDAHEHRSARLDAHDLRGYGGDRRGRGYLSPAPRRLACVTEGGYDLAALEACLEASFAAIHGKVAAPFRTRMTPAPRGERAIAAVAVQAGSERWRHLSVVRHPQPSG